MGGFLKHVLPETQQQQQGLYKQHTTQSLVYILQKARHDSFKNCRALFFECTTESVPVNTFLPFFFTCKIYGHIGEKSCCGIMKHHANKNKALMIMLSSVLFWKKKKNVKRKFTAFILQQISNEEYGILMHTPDSANLYWQMSITVCYPFVIANRCIMKQYCT